MLRTRRFLILSTAVLLFTLSIIFTGVALAAIFDRYADAVLGQPDFEAILPNNGGISAQSLRKPGGIAVDPVNGRLYVADTFNNRVLSWPEAAGFANQAVADMVFGQGGAFDSSAANNGGVSANSLNGPTGLAVDSLGNLYVSDTNNHRILRFDNPPGSDTTADLVFGQNGEFTTRDANKGGNVNANTLNRPGGLAIDTNGNLFIADKDNNRVLRYNSPLSDTQADLVIGQPNFTSATVVSPPTASSLNQPEAIATDATGNLYVADSANFRVLGFETPLSDNKAATRVFGQQNFTSNVEYCIGVPAADNLCNPIGIFVDSSGVLYISDVQFDRVMLFYNPLSSLPPVDADEVIGQPNFTSELTPKPPFSYGLDYPNAVFVDNQRILYLSDSNNNRVLRFDTAGATDFTYLPINRK